MDRYWFKSDKFTGAMYSSSSSPPFPLPFSRDSVTPFEATLLVTDCGFGDTKDVESLHSFGDETFLGSLEMGGGGERGGETGGVGRAVQKLRKPTAPW